MKKSSKFLCCIVLSLTIASLSACGKRASLAGIDSSGNAATTTNDNAGDENPAELTEDTSNQADNEQQTQKIDTTFRGVYAARQTLKDPASGLDAVTVLVPAGWNVSFQTDWSIVDTAMPCRMSIQMTSQDGTAKFVYTSPLRFFQYIESNNPDIEVSDDDGPNPESYETLLAYRDADEYQSYSLENALDCEITKISDLETDDFSLSRLRHDIEKIGEASVQASMILMAMTGQPLSVTLDEYDASIARNRYTCDMQGDSYQLEAVTSVMQYTTTLAQTNKDVFHTGINWTVLGDCYYMASDEQSFDLHHREYELIRDNIIITTEFIYLYQKYGSSIQRSILEGDFTAAPEMNPELAGQINENFDASLISSYDIGNFMNEYVFDNVTYQLDDGSTVTIPLSTGDVFTSGTQLFIGSEVYAPAGFIKKNPR